MHLFSEIVAYELPGMLFWRTVPSNTTVSFNHTPDTVTFMRNLYKMVGNTSGHWKVINSFIIAEKFICVAVRAGEIQCFQG